MKKVKCCDNGRIYLGKIKGKGKSERFAKGRTDITEDVLCAVMNYMAIHIQAEDVPELVYDCDGKKGHAVLTFKYVKNDNGDMGYQ